MTSPELLKKIDQIPPAYLAEVEDFVDFILQKKTGIPVKPRARTLGLLKGKLHMSPDFDEPLEEFKDYM